MVQFDQLLWVCNAGYFLKFSFKCICLFSRVSWVGNEGEGFSLEYPAISLHAVCRDLNAFPHECLYIMVDANVEGKYAVIIASYLNSTLIVLYKPIILPIIPSPI